MDSYRETDRHRARERSDPKNQFHRGSYLISPGKMECDSALSYVDNNGRWDIPSYIRLDVGLGWRPKDNCSLSVALLNLSEDHHPEYDTEQGYGSGGVKRSFYVKMMWQF